MASRRRKNERKKQFREQLAHHEEQIALAQDKEELYRGKSRFIRFGDIGWAFPLGGVLCGAYDSETGACIARTVDLCYFSSYDFKKQVYLQEQRRHALDIVETFRIDRTTTLIEVYSRNPQSQLECALAQEGYTVFKLSARDGSLRDFLIEQECEYVVQLAQEDLYFDPLGMNVDTLRRESQKVMQYIHDNNLAHLTKKGWKQFAGL